MMKGHREGDPLSLSPSPNNNSNTGVYAVYYNQHSHTSRPVSLSSDSSECVAIVEWMKKACLQADRSIPVSSAYCVGCVITRRGDGMGNEEEEEEVACGFSREIPGNTHAEECALIKLQEEEREEEGKCVDLCLYTTMEPCSERNSGRCPCVTRILEFNRNNNKKKKRKKEMEGGLCIRKVVIGVLEPARFVEKCTGMDQLIQEGIEVIVIKGMEQECLQNNTHLFSPMRLGPLAGTGTGGEANPSVFYLFETLLFDVGRVSGSGGVLEGFLYLDEHIQRLEESSRAFAEYCDKAGVKQWLRNESSDGERYLSFPIAHRESCRGYFKALGADIVNRAASSCSRLSSSQSLSGCKDISRFARVKVRFALGTGEMDGAFDSQVVPLGDVFLKESASTVRYICLDMNGEGKGAADKYNLYLQHKTSYRSVYDLVRQRNNVGQAMKLKKLCNGIAKEEAKDEQNEELVLFDAILFNQEGHITETTIANIAIALPQYDSEAKGGDGTVTRWITPPLSDGLLNGTFRRRLIRGLEGNNEAMSVEERPLHIDLFKKIISDGGRVVCFNSLRGIYPVQVVQRPTL
eukprot:Nk52_evm5s327 gene=Nk52_evmTU5s327